MTKKTKTISDSFHQQARSQALGVRARADPNATTPEQIRRAQLIIAREAHSPEECKEFLAMLGIDKRIDLSS